MNEEVSEAKTFIVKSLSDLENWNRNPRTISDKALKGLGCSLEEFGDLSSIVWNSRLQSLVCGHQRVKILQEKYNGQCRIENNVILTPNGERFPIRIVDWNESKHSAANIAANSQRISGDFTEGLAPILDELKIDLPDLSLNLNFDDLRLDYPKFFEKEVVEDEAPPIPKEARTKTGDLYELGKHRLLCGDSTKKEDVERLMDGKKAILFCTDPRYGVGYGDLIQNDLNRTRMWERMENDEIRGEDTQKFLEIVFNAWVLHLFDNAAWYIWHAQKVQGYFTQAAAGVIYHRQIVWVKPRLILGRGHYHWRHELCLYGWRKGYEAQLPADRTENTVWEFSTDNHRDYQHPTQKPVECFARPICNSTKEGDICAEAFAGSGTQLIAAEQLKRRCFGMEIEPLYVDVCVQRWLNFTKQTHIKLNGKQIQWPISSIV